MADIVMRRSFSPWFHLEFLFRLSPLGKKQAKYLATLHDMTDSVIKIRKDGYLQKKLNSSTIAERNDIGKARQFRRRHSDWLYSSSDKHLHGVSETFCIDILRKNGGKNSCRLRTLRAINLHQY